MLFRPLPVVCQISYFYDQCSSVVSLFFIFPITELLIHQIC